MKRKYWAKLKSKQVGPYPTREAAIAAFRAAYPFKGKPWEANAKDNQILTGYGEFGAYFDIQWSPRA